MQVFCNLDELPLDWGGTVISIGNFDGVHRGHQSVLARVAERARALKAKSVAVTFDPHPLRLLRPKNAPLLITPLPQKLAALAQTGIDATLVLSFDKRFSSTSAREFAQQIIAGKLHAKEVHEGVNFHFGHRAEGDCDKLKEFGKQF